MTTCQNMEELMDLTLDGTAAEEQRQALTEHLTTCQRCAATWQALQSVSLLLTDSPLAEPPADFVAKVMLGLERREQTRRRWVRGAFIGGTLLLALLGVAGLLMIFTLGSAWAPLPALRASLAIFFSQVLNALHALIRGFGVPLQLIGAGALIMLVGGLSLIATGCVAAWTWALARIERSAKPAQQAIWRNGAL